MAKKKATRIKGGTRPPDRVLTPDGEVPASSLPTEGPKRPIHFGRPKSNVEPEQPAKPLPGARAAQAFIDSLQQQ